MNLLVTFVNQSFTPDLKVGVLNTETGEFRWIILGIAGVGVGATGLAADDRSLYVCGQQSDLLVYDGSGFQQRFECESTLDPHTLKLIDDDLYCISSWTNEIIRFERETDGRITGESVFWRCPEADANYDSVHLNSLDHNGKDYLVTAFGKRESAQQSWSDIEHGFLMTTSGTVLRDGIKQPHSVYCTDEETYYCESLMGCLHALNSGRRYEVGGYTRGIVVEANSLFVGSSHRRKISKSTSRLIKGRTGTFEAGVQGSRITEIDLRSGGISAIHDLSAYGNEIFEIAVLPQFAESLADQSDALNARVRSFEYHASDTLSRAAESIESETAELKEIHKETIAELNDAHKAALDELSNELKTLIEQKSCLEAEIDQLSKGLSEAKEAQHELTKTAEEQSNQLGSLETENNELREQLTVLDTQNSRLERQHQELTELHQLLTSAHTDLLNCARQFTDSRLLQRRAFYKALKEQVERLSAENASAQKSEP